MKIGIFGGSFNPPHKMHLNIVEELLNEKILDKVTHAYSYGEAPLAIKTLNENLDLNIKEFVSEANKYTKDVFSGIDAKDFRTVSCNAVLSTWSSRTA